MELFRIQFSCLSKQIRKINPLVQKIFIIFCRIPSKKIENATTPWLFQLQKIGSQTPNRKSHTIFYRKIARMTASVAIYSYSLSNSYHSHLIQFCRQSFDTNSVEVSARVTGRGGREKSKLCVNRSRKNACTVAIFLSMTRMFQDVMWKRKLKPMT